MAEDKDKVQKIYDFMSTKGIKNFPESADAFRTKLSEDSSLSKNVHNYLLGQKVKNMPDDYDAFLNSLQLKKKEQAEDLVQQNLDEQLSKSSKEQVDLSTAPGGLDLSVLDADSAITPKYTGVTPEGEGIITLQDQENPDQELIKSFNDLDAFTNEYIDKNQDDLFIKNVPRLADDYTVLKERVKDGDAQASAEVMQMMTQLALSKDPGYVKFQQSLEGDDNIIAAKQLNKESKKLIEIVQQDKGLISGIGEGLAEYVQGYTQFNENYLKNKAVLALTNKFNKLEKGEFVEFSDTDKILLQSITKNEEVLQAFNDKVPSSYRIGSGLGQSLGFIGEFAATGGLAAVGRKAALKATAKYATGKKGLAAISTRLAAAGARTTGMPRLYQETGLNVSKGQNFIEGFGNAYYTVSAENLSEELFIGKLAPNASKVTKALNKTGIASVGGKNLKRFALSTGEEYVEEQVNKVLTSWQNYNSFDEFVDSYTLKGELETLATVSIMSTGMAAVSKGSDLAGEQLKKYKLSSVQKSLPKEIRDDVDEVLNNTELNPQEKYEVIGEIVKDTRATRDMSDQEGAELFANAIKYGTYKIGDQVGKEIQKQPQYSIGDQLYDTKEDFIKDVKTKLDAGEDIQNIEVKNDDGVLQRIKEMTEVPEKIEGKTETTQVKTETETKPELKETKEKPVQEEKETDSKKEVPEFEITDPTEMTEEGVIKQTITKEGKTLHSNDVGKMQPDAVRTWDSFVRDGEAIKNEDGTYQMIPKQDKIVIPKDKKAVSARAVSERVKSAKTELEAEFIKMEETKPEYSQDTEYQKAIKFIQAKTQQGDLNLDDVAIAHSKKELNTDNAAAAYSEAHKVFNKLSKDQNLTQEQRDEYSFKAADAVNRMANLALEAGQTSAMFAKIYRDNPAFDSRVRFVKELGKNKFDVLNSKLPDGRLVKDAISEQRTEVDNTVLQELDRLKKENTKFQKEIANLDVSKAKPTKKRAKEIANQVRKAKLPKDITFGTVAPVQAVWDGAVETVATAIEAGGTVAQAIQDGLSKIKKSDWYKNLESDKQKRFEEGFSKEMDKLYTVNPVEEVVDYHFQDKTDTRSLSEKLAQEAGLSKRQAQKIASLVNKEISKGVKTKLTAINKPKSDGLTKTQIERISDAVKSGALTDEAFTNQFAEKYGFNPISKEAAEAIESTVLEIDKLTSEGKHFLSRQRQVELNNKLKKLKPKELKDYFKALNDIRYGFILSAANTFYNANIGGLASITIEALPGFIAQGIKKGFLPTYYAMKTGVKTSPTHLKEFLAIANTHRGMYDDLNILDEAHTQRDEGIIESWLSTPFLNYSSEFARKVLGKEDARKLDDIMLDLTKNTLRKGLVVNSLIKAGDAAIRGSATDLITASEEFDRIATEMGYTGFTGFFKAFKDFKKIQEQTDKELALDKATQDNIKEQVQKEIQELKQSGDKIPDNYKSRRELELRKQKGNDEAYKRTLQSTSDFIMMAEPDGIPGWIYKGAKKIMNYDGKKTSGQWGAFVLNNLFLFSRMSANFANAVARNIPIIGAVNAITGYDVDQRTGEGQFTWIKKDKSKMFKRICTNAAITAAGTAMFMDMFEWDDDEDKFLLDPERHFDFTSYGHGDYKRNKAQGIDKNFAFRFRISSDSEWSDWHGTYLAPHIMPMVGFLGRWSDDLKGFGDEEQSQRRQEDWVNRIGSIADVSLRSLSEAQYNSMSRAWKKMDQSKDKAEAAINAANIVLAEPIKSTIQPSIVRDAINEVYRVNDINKKDAWDNKVAGAFKGMYTLDMFMKHDASDLYGNPVPRDSKFWAFADQYKKKYQDLPEYKLLDKYELLKRPDMYWKPTNKEYTDHDKFLARETARNSFGTYIKDIEPFLRGLPQERLEFAFQQLWDQSREDAMYLIDLKVKHPKYSEKTLNSKLNDFRKSPKVIRSLHKKLLKGIGVNKEEYKKKISDDVFKLMLQKEVMNY